MSGIGEFAYTILLGWMRALVNWFWSLFSGTGNTGIWQWFLSNWKVWLLVLLIGGILVDWIMWVVRWRPYRVLMRRLRRGKPAEAGDAEGAWDDGEGYYAPEIPADSDEMDWTDTTFATLSEIDPDWAGSLVIEEDEDPYYTDEVYGAAQPADAPLMEPAPYEAPYSDYEEADSQATPLEEEYIEPDSAGWQTYAPDAEASQAQEMPPAAPDAFPSAQGNGYDPFAPYDAYEPEEIAMYDGEQNTATEGMRPDESVDAEEASAAQEGALMYGRPGLWPGMHYPLASDQGAETDAATAAAESTPPEPEAYDPLFNPDAPPSPAPRRRRRRIREQVDAWAPEDPVQEEPEAPNPYARPAGTSHRRRSAALNAATQTEAAEDTRPSRVIRPEELLPPPTQPARKRGRKDEEDFRTVMGKPVKPRGLRRFSLLQEDPISGLPPMDVTDPYLPTVRPDDPDLHLNNRNP